VWYTLNDGELTEVYYSDLGTPSVRDLQFIVSGGKTFAERETEATTQSVQLVDGRTLEYRQINTDREYELMAGGQAAGRLSSIASTGNEGYMLPEQVWDDNPPSGQPGFRTEEGTFSATPLAWTHAQYVRLAWFIQDGEPVEQPSIVACRYTGRCP
jgi:GH15 family glucan-1,4-alpha-glucosidase